MEDVHPSLGIVQADVLFHYVNGDHPQMPHSRNDAKVRALSALFPELVHMRSYEVDLGGRLPIKFGQVCGDRLGTGSWITAQNIKRLLPTEWQSLTPVDHWGCNSANPLSPVIEIAVLSEAIDSVQPLDQATTVEPLTLYERLPSNIYFDEYQARVLGQFGDVYRVQPCQQRDRAYPKDALTFAKPERCRSPAGLEWQAWAVATDAVLVATDDVPHDVIARLLDHIESLDERCPKVDLASVGSSLFCDAKDRRFKRFPIAAHLEAKKKFLEQERPLLGPLVRALDNWVFASLVALISFGIVVWVILPMLLERFGRRSVLLGIAASLVVFLALSGALFLAEFRANPFFDIEKIHKGPWWLLHYWLLHYWVVGEPIEKLASPISLALVMAANLGVFLLVGLAGALLLAKTNRAIRPMTDHVIVFGVSQLNDVVLRELRRQRLTPQLVALRKGRIEENLVGSAMIADDLGVLLENACASTARCIILLSDEIAAGERGMGVDEHALVLARNIREIARKKGFACRIVAEVAHPEFREAMEGREEFDELVCVRWFGAELLAHAVDKRGIVDVFGELSVTNAGMEIYIDRLPDDVIRKHRTVKELRDDYYAKVCRGSRGQRLLIGIIRDDPAQKGNKGKVHLNPVATLRLQEGDSAIVIADEPYPTSSLT